MTTPFVRAFALLSFLVTAVVLQAQVPQIVNYQGRVAVGGVNFSGSGSFKFALVDTTGATTYWSNDGSSNAGSQPNGAVVLTVTNGLYSVLLGDTTLSYMTLIPASVFTNTDVRLRVWFNDGTHGFQLLTPDQRIAAVGYAMMAGGVDLPPTTSTTAGVIAQNGAPLIHSFGTANFFAGTNSGNFTMTGDTNTGIGASTLSSNTTGSDNFALGTVALYNNTSGQQNTAIGITALVSNTTGSYNIALGTGALEANTTGLLNTAIGQQALNANVSGGFNIALGYNAGSALTNGSNNIDIGSPGVVGDTNFIRLGDGVTQTDTFLTGVIHGNGSGLTGVTATNTIAPGSITNADLAAGSVTTADLAAGAVGTAQLASGAFAVPVSVAGTSQTAAANTAYTADSANLTNFSLPTTANVGDVVQITGAGAGGWSVSLGVWTQQTTGLPVNPAWRALASSADGTHLVAVIQGGGLYTSANSGATWTLQTSGLPPTAGWVSVASSSDGTHLIAVGGGDGIYTSTNSGATWTQQTSGLPSVPQWQAVASSADGTHLLAGVVNGGLYTSANSGASWTLQTAGLPASGSW